RQHLNYASLRAIECRRPIARSANTGISAFIDIRGKIFQPTKWDEEVVIKRTLRTLSANTFYVRFGDYIGRISAFIAVMFICFTLAKSKD
ncbi:MAG: apolipoprotein N-acyltransferase, partial [Flavobacteriales bacterium]|nr:apolipoprotein N-acyltransferase [Flavobacteriales bacterium]